MELFPKGFIRKWNFSTMNVKENDGEASDKGQREIWYMGIANLTQLNIQILTAKTHGRLRLTQFYEVQTLSRDRRTKDESSSSENVLLASCMSKMKCVPLRE